MPQTRLRREELFQALAVRGKAKLPGVSMGYKDNKAASLGIPYLTPERTRKVLALRCIVRGIGAVKCTGKDERLSAMASATAIWEGDTIVQVDISAS